LDAYSGNNALCKPIRFATIESLPLCEEFETVVPDFISIIDTDGISKWEIEPGTGCSQTNGNKSIVYNGSQGTFGGSTSDELLLLPFDLTNATSATLNFRIAEKQTYYCNTFMTLSVEASTDCGQTFTPLYVKNDAYTITSNCGGPSQCPCTQATAQPLYTTSGNFIPSEQAPWVPASCNDWRNESINLSTFLGAESVTLKFKATKADWQSNNLYLDNLCMNVSYNPLQGEALVPNQLPFAVFPNPGSGVCKIIGAVSEGETLTYRLISVGGQVVKSGDLPSVNGKVLSDLNMTEFNSGIYSLHLVSQTRSQVVKIIHQKR